MLKKIVNNVVSSFSTASIFQSLLIFSFIFTMSHYSDVEEYAYYRKVFYIIDFSTVISLFGVNNLLLRKNFDYYYENITSVISLFFAINIIATTIFAVLNSFSFGEFVLISCFVFFNALYQVIISLLYRSGRKQLYIIEVVTSFIVTIIGLVYFTKSGALTFKNVFVLRCLALAIYIVPFFISVRKNLSFVKLPTLRKITVLFKEVSPIGFGMLIGSCTLYIDKFLSTLLSSEQLAIYSNASADIPFVSVAITTMSACFIPLINKSFCEKDYSGSCRYISDLFIFGWYIGTIVFTILFINAEFVVGILYGNNYLASVPIFRVFCFSYLLKIVSYSHLIIALNLERIIIKRMLIELFLQFSMSILLLKIFGTLGLALSVVLVLALWSVPYNVYFFKKTLNCNLHDIFKLKTMLLFAVKTFLPCFLLYHLLSIFNLGLWVYFVATVALVFVIDFSECKYILIRLK